VLNIVRAVLFTTSNLLPTLNEQRQSSAGNMLTSNNYWIAVSL